MPDVQEVDSSTTDCEDHLSQAPENLDLTDDTSLSNVQSSDFANPVNLLKNPVWCWLISNRSDVLFWGVFAFFCGFLVLPLWLLDFLPLGDLPDHAGQIQVILNYENYQDDYRINWFTPYLVAYAITIFFGQIFSVATSIKIVLSLSVLSFPVGAYLLIRQLKGNRYCSLICIPAGYSFAFFWGFYSFIVGSALSVYFFVFVLAYARNKTTFKWYLAAFLLSLLLFFSHFMVWAIAISVTPLIIFMYNGVKPTVDKWTAFLLIAPIAAYWLSISGSYGNASAPVAEGHHVEEALNSIGREIDNVVRAFNERTEKGEHIPRAKELFSLAIGRGRMLDYTVLTVCLLVWPLFLGARLSRDIRRWLPLLYCFAMFMVVPYALLNTYYVYYRFAVFLLPFSLFIYQNREPLEDNSSTSLNWYGLVGSVTGFVAIYLILASNYSLFSSFKENDKNFSEILGDMKSGKMVQSLIFDADSRFAFSPAYLHFGSWYQAEKGGEVIFSFTHAENAFGVPVRYRHKTWAWPSAWNASEFNWRKHSGRKYDYFLVRSDRPRDYLFPVSAEIALIAKQGTWYLYGRKELMPNEQGKQSEQSFAVE